jgi:hypothetical protein
LDKVLSKINKLNNWQVALIILVVGFAVFWTGLNNPFQGDDIQQIVNNIPVHSIRNFKLLFEGGTFYDGNGLSRLSSVYYRPLMMISFATLYTLFGPHQLYFHLFQLLVCIGGSIFLYFFFRYSFKPALALFLSLVFLVHPLDSQVVYNIADLQEALCFFFGILALLLLLRFRSQKSLAAVIICLFLALLSKESGICFVGIALIYLLLWDRKRIYHFIGGIVAPLALYIYLRIKAVGLLSNPNVAPIDKLNLAGRLMTLPSIVYFYISKFVFPYHLASSYYWVYPNFSVGHFLFPLGIDLIVLSLIVYFGVLIKIRATKAIHYTYLFFTAWCCLGLILSLQIFPLDFTVTEPWFYFSMAGVLGMIGILLNSLIPKSIIKRDWLLLVPIGLVLILGVRTSIRGTDWSSWFKLAKSDAASSANDLAAYNNLSFYYENHSNYLAAKYYALKSVSIFPIANNYNALGQAQMSLKNYAGAYSAWTSAVKNDRDYYVAYDNLSVLTAYYGNNKTNQQFLVNAVNKFPNQIQPWFYLALLEYKINNITIAQYSITKAYDLSGQTNPNISVAYQQIMNREPLNYIK